MGHVFDKRLNVRLNANCLIALGSDLIVLLPSLMKDLRADRNRHLGKRFGQQFVQWLGAQATAQHQHPRFAPLKWSAWRQRKQLGSHRITGGAKLVHRCKGLRKGLTHTARHWHQQTIGCAGNRVLLVNDHGHTASFRCQATRACDVAPKSQNANGLKLTDNFTRLKQGVE